MVDRLVLGVARLAIGLPGVAEVCRQPGAGIVAGRALPAEMVGGPVLGMTRLAIGLPGMTEIGRCPSAGIVAGRALPAEMVGGPVLGMARLAIGCPSHLVVKGSRQPGSGGVAG